MEDEMTEDQVEETGHYVEVPKPKKRKPKAPALVPVKLLRDYRPGGNFKVWTIEETDEDGEPTKYGKRDPEGSPPSAVEKMNKHGVPYVYPLAATGEYARVAAGRIIDIPKAEANRLLKLRIAEKPEESYD